MSKRNQPPYRRLHPLYFGGSESEGTVSPEQIRVIEDQIELDFTDINGTIADSQVPESAVTQYAEELAALIGSGSGCCEPVAVAGELVFDSSGDVITTHTE